MAIGSRLPAPLPGPLSSPSPRPGMSRGTKVVLCSLGGGDVVVAVLVLGGLGSGAHNTFHAGLALAISVGACFNAGWLWHLMRRSGAYRPEPGWGAFLVKVAIALYLMGGAIWYTMGSEASWFEMTALARAIKLALVIVAAAAAYFASLAAMGFRVSDFSRSE